MRPRSGSSRPRAQGSLRSRLTAARAACLALLAACASPAAIERFQKKHGEFAARATYLPPISLTGSSLPEGTIHNEPGELEFTQVVLDASVPIPRDDDGFLIVGALAGVRDVRLDGVPVLEDEELHRYGVRLGYGRYLDDDLLVQAYWQPSIYSDLDGTLNSDDYRPYYGVLLAVRRTSPTWFWKAGIASNDALDTVVIPLGGFAWHFADRWSVQLLAPRDASLVYQDGPWLAYLGFLLEADEYHVRSPDALDLEHDVHVQELYLHLSVERALTHGVSVMIRGGSTVAGHWDWGYGSGSERLDGTLEPDPFVAAGINYRF